MSDTPRPTSDTPRPTSDTPQLRRTDKQMSDAQLRELIARGYCGRLATVGPGTWPYVVPLLYVFLDGEIWVHNTRATGHLRANVEQASAVCFELDEAGKVFPYGRFECDTSIAYRSAVIFGHIRIVEERAKKQAFFEAFMAKYGDPAWVRPRGLFPRLDQVTVYAIAIERMTGKEAPLPALEKQWPALDRTKSPEAQTDPQT
ncbi:MAG TPA: pyridoxamine 5'-phosphate oxidase family protein [Steroidobacteraceae bacterium]|nr:pyridoxamine 5'-phosphate oxidase family protein [Steroidobacteraceae bacterium]